MPLGQRTDCGDARYAGVEVAFAADIAEKLEESSSCGFDFLTAPLTRPGYRRRPTQALPQGQLHAPFSRPDVLLASGQWSSQVVGIVSPWIAPDSADTETRLDSQAALQQELDWAAHLSLQACVLPSLSAADRHANYGRILGQFLAGLSNMALWVRVPLQPEAASRQPPGPPSAVPMDADRSPSGSTAASPPLQQPAQGGRASPGQLWNELQTLTGFSNRLGVLLEIGQVVPPQQDVERWLGEPVKALALPTSAFLQNRKGFPVLPKAHQELLTSFLQLGVQVLLVDDRPAAEPQAQPEAEPTPAESAQQPVGKPALQVAPHSPPMWSLCADIRQWCSWAAPCRQSRAMAW